ncbi:maintenance of telomere capping protein 1 [Crepidotus variabilis]|uniref:Maintenance of telomere capping protein 1 n=1 Tax=Crepidotus variabilis TaxID=179855 RepID=A0A9P6EV96_9AGAR|nr:maintenance of telomere capping protein 1 [Crepidotus variabilis]
MASKKSRKEEALQFLDDLDSFSPPGAGTTAPSAPKGGPTTGVPAEGEAEVLAFLDEITQKSTEPTRAAAIHSISRSSTPISRKSTERVKIGGSGPASSSTTSLSKTLSTDGTKGKERDASAPATTNTPLTQGQGAGWGWGSVWTTASAAIQQAKSVVDEQVKHIPKNEQALKWGQGALEYAKTAQLDKLGQDFKRVGLSTLTDILNVVAPPISEHEVIQVWLSHDMQGYEGIESLSYRALARILEQVEGGDLVLNKGNETKPKETGQGRELNAVDDYETALKVAQVNIEDVIKKNVHVTETTRNPNISTTYSNVFLRVQPFYTTFTQVGQPETAEPERHLQFLLYLFDPPHKLTHTTVTQVVPSKWIALWDDYDWVEDLVAESLRVGVEVLGQEYVVSRMGWGKKEEHGKEGSTSVDPGEHSDKADESS